MKLKQWKNIFHMIVKASSIIQQSVHIKNGIIKHVNVNVKIIAKVELSKKCQIMKKDYSWNISTYVCENSKYLKSIADTSVITCYEIISVMDIASTKVANTIATNVTKNCYNEKVRDCYILNTVLLVIILLLTVTIFCFHYAKWH